MKESELLMRLLWLYAALRRRVPGVEVLGRMNSKVSIGVVNGLNDYIPASNGCLFGDAAPKTGGLEYWWIAYPWT